MRCGLIPWADVRGLPVHSVKGTHLLGLHVTDDEPNLARIPGWRRATARSNPPFGFPHLTIGFVGLSPGYRQVMDAITDRLGT
jgi:hypothetical protein